MIGRLWRIGLKPGQSHANEEFARDVSLPMFRQQKGFLGCMMIRSEEEGFVLTFWRDMDGDARLDYSRSYQATFARIIQENMLAGEQSRGNGRSSYDVAGMVR